MKFIGSFFYILVSMGISEIAQLGRAGAFQSRHLIF